MNKVKKMNKLKESKWIKRSHGNQLMKTPSKTVILKKIPRGIKIKCFEKNKTNLLNVIKLQAIK